MSFERVMSNHFVILVVLSLGCFLGTLKLFAQENRKSDEAAAMHDHVKKLYLEGKYAEALPIAKSALELREKALGPEHTDIATSLHDLALLYYEMGDFAKAEPLYQRGLKIREKVLGPEHSDTAMSLNDLALLYYEMGDFAKAVPAGQQALKIREKVLGVEHSDTASTLNNLAAIYYEMGEYTTAEPIYQRALKIREKVLGPEHPDTAMSLNGMAWLYEKMGDYAKAEPFCQRGLKIREKALGHDHRLVARSVNNLAYLYKLMGDYTKAEPLYCRGLKIYEKALGLEHPDTAQTLNNLANLYFLMGDYAKAEPLLQRALKIREKTLDPEHPDTAGTLYNLAKVHQAMGDYAKAEPLLQRALKIREKMLGPEHPYTATSLNGLALFYKAIGDYAKAEPLLQRALKICEKALGPEHPDTALSLKNVAFLMLDLQRPSESLDFARRAGKAELRTLANILSFTSERQRLAFQATLNPYNLFGSMGQASDMAMSLLRYKGVVLDSLVEDRIVAEASSDPKKLRIVEDLRDVKRQLIQLMFEQPKDLSDIARKKREAAREALSEKMEGLESILARQVVGVGRTRRALDVTVEQIQKVLPPQSVLIEQVKYEHYLGKNKWERRYGAVILGVSDEPKWISMGEAKAIEKNVVLYQKSVRGKTDEATFSEALRALGRQVWEPIEQNLPKGITTVIVSPDGELNFVSLATLLTADDRLIGQKYSLRYVSSGRDLLKEKIGRKSESRMVAWANPEFNQNSGGKGQKSEKETAEKDVAQLSRSLTMREMESRDFRGLKLSPLPGTEKEGRMLKSKVGGWGLGEVGLLMGSEATEESLAAVRSPTVLHLATHGFFLPETESLDNTEYSKSTGFDSSSPPFFAILKNPMHRSGLALTGAQTTLQAWGRGETPPSTNDGVVMADEVGVLKLEDTWLVVLSACDTGSGEAKTGEGVLGLRRGFVQAGAQNLLMTLWPVTDEETVAFMESFYSRASKLKDAPQALADVQREWLERLRKEKGLLYAVRVAGPFVLNYQGNGKL